jgi:thiamine-phosphate diphosphorylase/hydroxyethylthiazole kinase
VLRIDAVTVRRLIGNDKIIGVSVNTLEEAKKAVQDGADYLGTDLIAQLMFPGIGAIFDTSTKQLTTPLCGIKGLREILKFTASKAPLEGVRTVAIGGLNASNIARVCYQSETPSISGAELDGVAVVSALISASHPVEAARRLKNIIGGTPTFATGELWLPSRTLSVADIGPEISKILNLVQEHTPLVHHLTNNVCPPIFWLNTRLSRTFQPMSLLHSEHPRSCPKLHWTFQRSQIFRLHILLS